MITWPIIKQIKSQILNLSYKLNLNQDNLMTENSPIDLITDDPNSQSQLQRHQEVIDLSDIGEPYETFRFSL